MKNIVRKIPLKIQEDSLIFFYQRSKDQIVYIFLAIF